MPNDVERVSRPALLAVPACNRLDGEVGAACQNVLAVLVDDDSNDSRVRMIGTDRYVTGRQVLLKRLVIEVDPRCGVVTRRGR